MSLKYFPFYYALHRALEQYVSNEAASMLTSAFALDDSKELRNLFKSEGFNNIDICLIIKQMRYSPLKEFLVGGFVASPFTNEILALEKSKREEMFQMSFKNWKSSVSVKNSCNISWLNVIRLPIG